MPLRKLIKELVLFFVLSISFVFIFFHDHLILAMLAVMAIILTIEVLLFHHIENKKSQRIYTEEDRTFKSYQEYTKYQQHTKSQQHTTHKQPTLMQKYLKILELPESEKNLDSIKQQYKKLAKKYHPDLNPENEEQMKKINEAYNFLKKSLQTT